MTFKSFTTTSFAALALCAASMTANATTFELGTIAVGTPKPFVAFGGGTALQSFNDQFNFTLAAGTGVSGYSVAAFDFDFFGTSFKTTFSDISLYKQNGTLVGSIAAVGKNLSLTGQTTLAGNYYLKVSGSIDNGGNGYFYNGAISSSAVTPVPEPESVAMMLAGLGVMGVIARRRNKKAQA